MIKLHVDTSGMSDYEAVCSIIKAIAPYLVKKRKAKEIREANRAYEKERRVKRKRNELQPESGIEEEQVEDF